LPFLANINLASVLSSGHSSLIAQRLSAVVYNWTGGRQMRRLTTADVMQKLGIRSRETLRQLAKNRGFPKPIHDEGSTINYYLEHEVDAYLKRQAEARDRASPVELQQPQVAA
jgi:predicted DNA-binding transcriptional regulator AlpA